MFGGTGALLTAACLAHGSGHRDDPRAAETSNTAPSSTSSAPSRKPRPPDASTQRLKTLTHPAVLVVDEIGYLPVTRPGPRRYERASMVLTSNQGFERWGEIPARRGHGGRAARPAAPPLPHRQHPQQRVPRAPHRSPCHGGACGRGHLLAGTLKGVGKVYIQTVLDCFSRHVWARLYTSKMPVTAVQILNNHVLPFFEKARRPRPDHLERKRARVLRPPGQAPLRALPAAEGHRAPNHEGRETPVERFHRAVPPHAPRRASPDHGADDLVRDRSRRCSILRPTTGGDRTDAAAWRDGRPTPSSRPGSLGSAPINPQPGRR